MAVDPVFFPYVILFLGFSISAIFVGLSIFSLAAPKEFVEWFTPYLWLKQRYKFDHWDAQFSLGCAIFFLVSLFVLQFFLGGIVTTMIFKLRLSPFAVFL
jgi:hypothetical protein